MFSPVAEVAGLFCKYNSYNLFPGKQRVGTYRS